LAWTDGVHHVFATLDVFRGGTRRRDSRRPRRMTGRESARSAVVIGRLAIRA
jgi:hypothetical protein